MAQTIVIQPNSTNTVKVNVSAVPDVKITPPVNKPVKVCSKVEFNITNITGGGGGTDPGTHDHEIQIDQDLDVTNTDTAIGDALGAFYPAGTDIETILRNILIPSADSEINNYKLIVSLNGVTNTEVSSETYEWGVPLSVVGHKFTLSDPDDKFIDSENLFLVFSIYSPTTQGFPVSTFGVSDWSELPANQTITSPDVQTVQIPYTDSTGFSKQFNSQLRLNYADTAGTEQATATASVRFAKKHWLISSEIDLTSGSFTGTYNDLLSDSSTTIMDSGLTTSGNLSLVTDATAFSATRFTYIVMPSELDMNTTDGSVVTTGVFNVGNAFIEHGSTLSYFSGFTDAAANNVDYNVRLFQSDQTQAYTSGITLNVTAT